jgi:hypothetical protein
MTGGQPTRFPGRFAVAVAASYAADGDELARAFRGLGDDNADALGRELLAGMEQAAKLTGDWRWWAFACNRIPWSHVRLAGRELGARLDAWAAEPRRMRGAAPRKALAKLALRLLRQGMGGRALLHRLDEANGTLSSPLPADAVGDVALWAAAAVNRGASVAR